VDALIRLIADDNGATMAEYAIMVSLIAVVCIAAVLAVGKATSSVLFQQVAESL
jgi:Flp pilus assembly pilin Flp